MVKEFIPEVRNCHYDSIFSDRETEINLPKAIQFIMYYSPNLSVGNALRAWDLK